MDLDTKSYLDDMWRNDQKVLCPKCGASDVHIERVDIDQGKNFCSIARDAAIQIEERKPQARGSNIQIWFWCEDYHHFTLEFQFHKGVTFFQSGILPDLDPEEAKELWRD